MANIKHTVKECEFPGCSRDMLAKNFCIAKEFGVKPVTISDIKHNRLWTDVQFKNNSWS